MCLGVVGSDGQRMPLHWFRPKKGERGLTNIILHDVINLDELQVMDTVVLPWIEETYGEKDIVTASNK